jgi:signal transduction histidine kinase
MRLRIPEFSRKTLGFRLTLWYSGIFILSCLIVFLLSYVFLSSSLRSYRDAIEIKSKQYTDHIKTTGVTNFQADLENRPNTRRRAALFVRVIGAGNETLYLNNPLRWQRFDLESRKSRPADGEWRYFHAINDGDTLEVLSTYLPDGAILQVGRRIQTRDEILERFRDTILAVTIPMILIGMAGGAFLAFRALRPIRELSKAVRRVIETAHIDARVPVSRTDDELDELVRLFNQMLDKIAVLIGGMREALDNVAHDLRTPMTRLRILSEEALQSNSGSDLQREALADCLEETEHVIAILDTLTDISEAETGTMRLLLEEVNVSALIDEVLELYQYVAEEKDIHLSASASEELWLSADPRRMRQVLANLLDNAIKYTPNGGKVEIEAFKTGQKVVVLFKDTGIGISAEDMPRIWDRLYRGDKSRSQRGLGLGLSLVRAVVHAHHGHVEASHNPGGGSLFTLHLTLTPAV